MKHKIKKLIILLMILMFPFNTNALMKSDNYVIYETVMQSFDGPTLASVTCVAGVEQITVAWNTDVIADSFVVYDTANTFANNKEQGSSVKNSTSHSVVITGLTGGTTYYYKVKSTRTNGGTATDTNVYTCAPTAATAAVCPTCQTSSGGGLLIIDKTDKEEPLISDIEIVDITYDSATIKWKTGENATSFIKYGKDSNYGKTVGQWDAVQSHTVILNNLEPLTEYRFKALSSDSWGNLGQSTEKSFTTAAGGAGEEATAIEEITDQIKKLSDLIPAPIFSGEPRVEVESDKATVYWQTDKEANSFVAVAPEASYRLGGQEPYQQVVGDPEIMTRDHVVRIFGLQPNTLYHFQLRSKADAGPMGRSKDYTFRTSMETLEITSYYSQVVNDTSAMFKWVTNFEADSAVKITPYRGNTLAIEESKIFKDNAQSVIHEISIEEFEGGVIYAVELSSQDTAGNRAAQAIPQFSTSKDDLPPEITDIKVDSTIFLDKEGKIQTIISWTTNEPATSRAYYQEGVQPGEKELQNATDLNDSYTKDHIMVFTKFQPGKVYSFRAESIDSGGNASISKIYTFMTPKKKESIFQMIIRILEQTFGWIKKII